MFDAVLADAGIDVVLSGVRMPRMNSIMERWVQTCRRELLDRSLICNQRHLLHALREFEQFYNGHRPHQGIANARPLYPLPTPIVEPDKTGRLDVRKRDPLAGAHVAGVAALLSARTTPPDPATTAAPDRPDGAIRRPRGATPAAPPSSRRRFGRGA
jgi:hypothetical protein